MNSYDSYTKFHAVITKRYIKPFNLVTEGTLNVKMISEKPSLWE